MRMTEELIYEKLAPDEVLIIARAGDAIIYATNRNGELIIKRALFPKEVTA